MGAEEDQYISPVSAGVGAKPASSAAEAAETAERAATWADAGRPD